MAISLAVLKVLRRFSLSTVHMIFIGKSLDREVWTCT